MSMIKHNNGSKGGYLVGRKHSEGGIPVYNKGTDTMIEVEGGEAIITAPALSSTKKFEFEGREMTPREILSSINEIHGGVAFAKGGEVGSRIYNVGGELMTGEEVVTMMERESNPFLHIAEKLEKGGIASTDDFDFSEMNEKERKVIDAFTNGYAIVRFHGHAKKSLPTLAKSRYVRIVSNPKEKFDVVYLSKQGQEKLGVDFEETYLLKDVYRKGGMTESDSKSCYDIGGMVAKKYDNGGALVEPEMADANYYRGTDYKYSNPYELNKAIEELVASRGENLTADQKFFISQFSGYGGLEKFGATGVGLLFEYFTPDIIVQKMWGLAYKYGYSNGAVLEPSSGVGAFLKYVPNEASFNSLAIELNPVSYGISKILYPNIQHKNEKFERMFLKNNASVRGKVEPRFHLVIGNPPYGKIGGFEMGMGEDKYTKASNYIEYFILRGLDLLHSGGLLIYIVGAETSTGGSPFLMKGNSAIKDNIAEKSVLLDAYRLPNGVFERTDVLSEIIVLKKL
jgi:hypothetical protein